MDAVELAKTNLRGSDGAGGVRVSGTGDAVICSDTGHGLIFSSPEIERCSALVAQRGSEYNSNGLDSPSWIKKAEAGSCRNTIQLSTSDSLVLAAGSKGKRLQKKEKRVQKSVPACFKIPQAVQMETSFSTSEDSDMKDVLDELGSLFLKSPNADNYQLLKPKNNLHSRRGDKKNIRVPLNGKQDVLTGFRPAQGGLKVFGTYGLKADIHDITRHVNDISLSELLDGSYKSPIVGKEVGKRPATTSEHILHLAKKAFSILHLRGLSQANKQNDEIDVAITKELYSVPISNLSKASNFDVDNGSSAASESSFTKVLESCANTEAPMYISNLPLYQPRDVFEKLAIPFTKDLDSLLQNEAKPAVFSRCNDSRSGKLVSRRVALSTFSWSHNHIGHNKFNSDSVKMSSKSSCQGRWLRIGKAASFFEGSIGSLANLESLAYDHSLVPSGLVKYILPNTQKIVSKTSDIHSSGKVLPSLICPTSSQSPPALRAPGEITAAQALYDIANNTEDETAHSVIKWPKLPSHKAMKARKSKSIQGSEILSAPQSKAALDNTDKFTDHSTPLKKARLLSSFEKKDHSAHPNAPRPPHFWSSPRSIRLSPIRPSREPALDSNRHHANGFIPKTSFIAPPRRVLEKTNHSQQQKLRKVLQMDWNRGKGQL